MYSTFYLFHVANAKDFMRGKAPAELEQIGPFVFQKQLKRKVFGFNEDETEINFQTNVYFKYRPDLSNETAIDQNITMVNLPLAVSDIRNERKTATTS